MDVLLDHLDTKALEAAPGGSVGMTFINKTTTHYLIFYLDGQRAAGRLGPGDFKRITTTSGRHTVAT